MRGPARTSTDDHNLERIRPITPHNLVDRMSRLVVSGLPRTAGRLRRRPMWVAVLAIALLLGSSSVFMPASIHGASSGFALSFGGSGVDQSHAIAKDTTGNVYVAGGFQGTVDFGAGPLTSAGGTDIFLLKLDANGTPLWSRRFGGAGDDVGYGVAVDGSGNAYLTGSFQGAVNFGSGLLASAGGADAFVLKVDTAGNTLWSRSFGAAGDDVGNGVAVDGAGNAYLTGSFHGAVDFGTGALASAGGSDVFVVKLDSNGNTLWSRRFGGSADGVGNGVALDGSGNPYLTGSFHGAVDLGSGPLASAGGADIFALKLDTTGATVWSRAFGGPSDDLGSSVAVDGSGNAYLTGSFQGAVDFGAGPLTSAGGTDIFLLKLDPTGSPSWSNVYGGPSNDLGSAVTLDGTGNAYLTGSFQGLVDFGAGPLASSGGMDVFLAKVDSNGATIAAQDMGGAAADAGQAVVPDTSGNAYLTGYFSGTASFNTGSNTVSLTSAGNSDVFVVKTSLSNSPPPTNTVTPTSTPQVAPSGFALRFGGPGVDQSHAIARDSAPAH
jgi:Beta-propeller repeat